MISSRGSSQKVLRHFVQRIFVQETLCPRYISFNTRFVQTTLGLENFRPETISSTFSHNDENKSATEFLMRFIVTLSIGRNVYWTKIAGTIVQWTETAGRSVVGQNILDKVSLDENSLGEISWNHAKFKICAGVGGGVQRENTWNMSISRIWQDKYNISFGLDNPYNRGSRGERERERGRIRDKNRFFARYGTNKVLTCVDNFSHFRRTKMDSFKVSLWVVLLPLRKSVTF